MKRSTRWIVLTAVAVVVAALWTAWRFERDIKVAYTKAAQGSPLVDTRCGPIEYQEAGAGTPLLMVHGSGGGHDQVIGYVLATPPEQVSDASPEERARINNMLDHILPVSARAAGLRSDSVLGKNLGHSALGSVRAPTLIVSVRDDGFGTYASAQYTASQIKGAKFRGFEHGGHVWVGHDDEVMAKIANLLSRVGQ